MDRALGLLRLATRPGGSRLQQMRRVLLGDALEVVVAAVNAIHLSSTNPKSCGPENILCVIVPVIFNCGSSL